MKKSTIFFILFCCTVNLFAQDLIVTGEGDSLNCKITKKNSEYIYFTFKHKEEYRSTLLPLNQVKSYQEGFYQEAVIPVERVVFSEQYNHWRIALSGGWSYQTARIDEDISSDLRDYAEKLKTGGHFNAGITYYYSEAVGFGLEYSVFKTSNMVDNVTVTYPGGETRYGTLSDNISITYVGPSYYTRLLHAQKKNALLVGISLGYMEYRNKGYVIDEYAMSGGTLGYMLDVGYDIGLSKNLALGFNLALYSGFVSSLEQTVGASTQTITLEGENRIGLGRLDLSAGLRFNF